MSQDTKTEPTRPSFFRNVVNNVVEFFREGAEEDPNEESDCDAIASLIQTDTLGKMGK